MATSTIPSIAFSTTPATTQVPSECNTVKMALVISYYISSCTQTHTARSYKSCGNFWEAGRLQYTI